MFTITRDKMQEHSQKTDMRMRIHRVLLHAGGWVSGEDLAARFGVSRAAVGKHVARLRREGNLIQSSTKKGFWLRIPAERIDPELVRPHLATRRLGRERWVCLEETASTNTEALALALSGAGGGAVVTAERQSAGKGRKGHGWLSLPRSLQFSLLFPSVPPEENPDLLVEKAQRALVRAVKTVCPLNPVPKPPNDVLVEGRKLAGILVESGLRAGEVDWVVLGVGCNVNALPEEFPAAIAGKTTSVLAACGAAASRNRLLAEFLNALEELL